MAVRMFGRGIDYSREGSMTTDPDEGRRQIKATKPPAIKVGDTVRLRAGGERTMTIVALEDYGNMAVCEWQHHEGALAQAERDTLPVSGLVLAELDKKTG
jgi:uncharacterized protein YodC (DUF2158 family)